MRRVAEPKSTRVSVPMAERDRATLATTAEKAGISTAQLARVFVGFCLAELARGNRELERAIKTSRDA